MARLERIVFFGTPAFAVPALEALVAAGRAPALVVTQPARPAGRGRRLLEPPVAEAARRLALPVEAVARVGAPEFLDRLGALAPDLAVVVAFGQIFPRALLELPRLGCLNVHASLLPRWRGAAPIAAAIAAGDARTGISIQRMEEGLDSGPVYGARATPIGERESAGELAERLARIGAELLIEVLTELERGRREPTPQVESLATRAPKLAGVRVLDPGLPAATLARQVRAYNPEPGTAILVRDEHIKVIEAEAAQERSAAPPGTLLASPGAALALAAGDGSVLRLILVQRPGGRPISGRDLANGLRLTAGERLH